MDNNKIKNTANLAGINEAKFLLILGVVLIHCDISNEYSKTLWGVKFCNDISFAICDICVPCFFIISGFLFFNNVKNFTLNIYFDKLQSRIRTLFIPYMFWCTICMVLLFIKSRFLHMYGLEIFLDNGRSIDWINLLKGYWSIEVNEGFPYAFAFWFIRNLMVFIILSPLAWLLGKNTILFVIFMFLYFICDVSLYGFEWFVIGVFISTHNIYIKHNLKYIILVSAIFWISVLLKIYGHNYNIILFIKVVSGLYLTYFFSKWIYINNKSVFIKKLIGSTFMIYATHQCYCTKTREFFMHLYGNGYIIQPILAYISSFIIMVLLGFICNLILKKYLYNFYKIITGGR